MRVLILALAAATAHGQGVVEGVVSNAVTGAPLAGVDIQFERGERFSVRPVQTDAQGAYRVEALAPGTQIVKFSKQGFIPLQQRAAIGVSASRLDIRLMPAATLSGRVLDPDGKPVPKAPVQLLAVGRLSGHNPDTNGKGEFVVHNVTPGMYTLSARPANNYPDPPSEDGRPRAWARTYFPGTERREAAAKVTVTPGADLFGQDIVLRSVPARRVRGRVLRDGREPVAGASLTLIPDGEVIIRDVELKTRTDSNGAFEFPRAYDGGWKLEVALDSPKLAADRRLVISGDIERLDVELRPSFDVPGRLILDPGAPVPHIGVVLTPPGSGSHFFNAPIENSGEFHLKEVTEGPYMVRMIGLQPPDYIASIRLGEREILGETVEIVSGALPITITAKRDGGTVRGTVEDCGGGTVLLAPQNANLPPRDFVRGATCRDNGAFEIVAVRPGEYYAYAFAEPPGPLEYGILATAPLTNQAARVTVRPNEATQVSLKLLPGM